MSAISSQTTSPQQLSVQPTTDPYREMTSSDFMDLIFTELSNQDPTEPTDTKALLDQISTIRAIESDLQLSDRLDQVVRQNEIAASSALVGKFATGLTDSFVEAAGFVDAVRVTDEGVRLILSSGQEVTMENVRDIIDPALIGTDDGVNTRPTASDDEALVAIGGEVTINVLANDSDDSSLDASSVEIVTRPKHGTVEVDPNTGVLTYTHDGGAATGDVIEYKVADGDGLKSSAGRVTITIGSAG